MKRVLLLATLLLSSLPAAAVAPGKGSFGIAGTFSSGFPGSGVQFTPGLSGTVWATDQLQLGADLVFGSQENAGTRLGLNGRVSFYPVKTDDFGAFVTGALGFANYSPPVGDGTTQVALQLGGGAEYFMNRHFGVALIEGLNLHTKPTTFNLDTELRLSVYF